MNQRAIEFVEVLAEKLVEKRGGVVTSRAEWKSLLSEAVGLLSQGRLRREIVKYRPLYSKRFLRCVRKVKLPSAVSSGIPDDQPSQSESAAQSAAPARPAQCIRSRDTTDARQPGESKKIASVKNGNVSSEPKTGHLKAAKESYHLTLDKVQNVQNVAELQRKAAFLYHHSDSSLLISFMDVAVREFTEEVKNVIKKGDLDRASHIHTHLHQMMIYFHFKSELVKKLEGAREMDGEYDSQMTTLMSLYISLSAFIVRTGVKESTCVRRITRQPSCKAWLLLRDRDQLMVALLGFTGATPIDAPYLLPTLRYVIKNRPCPLTPLSYLRYMLVCRLARAVLQHEHAAELADLIQVSLGVLPPGGLTSWLTGHCPDLAVEIPVHSSHTQQLSSFLLQVASHDLCQRLVKCVSSLNWPVRVEKEPQSSRRGDQDAPAQSDPGPQPHMEDDDDDVIIIEPEDVSSEDVLGDLFEGEGLSPKPASISLQPKDHDTGTIPKQDHAGHTQVVRATASTGADADSQDDEVCGGLAVTELGARNQREEVMEVKQDEERQDGGKDRKHPQHESEKKLNSSGKNEEWESEELKQKTDNEQEDVVVKQEKRPDGEKDRKHPQHESIKPNRSEEKDEQKSVELKQKIDDKQEDMAVIQGTVRQDAAKDIKHLLHESEKKLNRSGEKDKQQTDNEQRKEHASSKTEDMVIIPESDTDDSLPAISYKVESQDSPSINVEEIVLPFSESLDRGTTLLESGDVPDEDSGSVVWNSCEESDHQDLFTDSGEDQEKRTARKVRLLRKLIPSRRRQTSGSLTPPRAMGGVAGVAGGGARGTSTVVTRRRGKESPFVATYLNSEVKQNGRTKQKAEEKMDDAPQHVSALEKGRSVDLHRAGMHDTGEGQGMGMQKGGGDHHGATSHVKNVDGPQRSPRRFEGGCLPEVNNGHAAKRKIHVTDEKCTSPDSFEVRGYGLWSDCASPRSSPRIAERRPKSGPCIGCCSEGYTSERDRASSSKGLTKLKDLKPGSVLRVTLRNRAVGDRRSANNGTEASLVGEKTFGESPSKSVLPKVQSATNNSRRHMGESRASSGSFTAQTKEAGVQGSAKQKRKRVRKALDFN